MGKEGGGGWNEMEGRLRRRGGRGSSELFTFPLDVFRTQPVRLLAVAAFLVWELYERNRS